MRNFTKLLIAALVVLVSTGVYGQYQGYKTYGYYYAGHSYDDRQYMPHHVKKVVKWYHRYHGYKWVGTTEFYRGHRPFFIVTLVKGPRIIKLTINRNGNIIRKERFFRDYYPHPVRVRRGKDYQMEIYRHDGYVFSRRDDLRFQDYPWESEFETWKDEDHHMKGNQSKGKKRKYR